MIGPFTRRTEGTAAVEFALAFPLALLVVVGLFDASRAAYTYVTVADASAEGARYITTDPGATQPEIEAFVRRRVAMIDASALTVRATYHDGIAWRDWQPWPSALTDATVTLPVRVEASYAWSASAFLLAAFSRGQLVTTSIAEAKP